MSVIEKYLAELDRVTVDAAINSLASPVSKDAFGLGVAVGLQEGLKLARTTLEKVLGDDGDGENENRSFAGQRPIIEPRPRSRRAG